MKKTSLAACALTLLLAACGTSVSPTTAPDSASTPVTSDAEIPTEVQTQDAESRLGDLALKAPAQGSSSRVRADGTLLVGGQPMFPMGFYHVSWAGDAQKRLRDLQAIASMGFNVMNATMFDPQEDLDGYRKLLDTAQSRGVKLMIEDFNAVSIAALKSHPATLGWMIADDCNNLITPSELQRRHQATKALDPDHLTYTSMAISFADSHLGYFGNADAIGNQSYPVDGGDSVGVVYPVMRKLVEQSAAKGTLPIANLQSFRWTDGRYPTPRELNSMTNQALAAGVKGILYYTYLDKTNDLAQYSGLNSELRKLAAEVKLLAPVLMNGERQALTLPASVPEARATLWSYEGRRYLQVLNLSENDAQKLRLALPAGSVGLTPLFAGRAATLSVSSGQITGTLPALGAQWYEVR